MLKKILLLLICSILYFPIYAQLTYGVTGLLHMPSAEMQKDKTIMIGGNYLNKHNIPSSWGYNTYNYFLNVTIFPCLEVNYTCTLLSFGEWGKNGKRYNNQDRYFSARLRILKEGQFFKYMPAIVVGTSDPFSHSITGFKEVGLVDGSTNGYFNRYYIALSKHFNVKRLGILGTHLAYIYGNRYDFKFKGLAIGVDFCPSIYNKLNIIAEYDSKDINLGFSLNLPFNFNATFELQSGKYVSAGIAYIHCLK